MELAAPLWGGADAELWIEESESGAMAVLVPVPSLVLCARMPRAASAMHARLSAGVGARPPLPVSAKKARARGGTPRRWRRWTAGRAAAAGANRADDAPEPAPEPEAFDAMGAPRVFKRLKERDPYRLLGIQRDADYEEIHGAYAYLTEEYAMHEPSREAIDVAHDQILKERMMSRQKSGKLNIKGRGGKEVSFKDSGGPRTPLNLITDRMEEKGSVKTHIIRRNAAVFAALATWAFLVARVADPTVQIAIGAGACCYFLNQKKLERAKKDPLIWCIGQSVLFLALGWLVGAVVPALLPDSIVVPASITPALLAAWGALASLFVGAALQPAVRSPRRSSWRAP